MVKLIYYEFRKALVALLSLIGVAALLQLSFWIAIAKDDERMLAITVVCLSLCAFAVSIFVMVRGITTYSSELRSTSGYLTFLTPNSALKIVGSKFLYTFVNALLAFIVFIAVFALDFAQLMKYYGMYESLAAAIADLLSTFGVYVNDILAYGVFIVGYLFLALLAVVAVAYFSYTISVTLFRDKNWKWAPAVLLFLLINWGVNRINNLFASPLERLNLIELNIYGNAAAPIPFEQSLRAVVLPALAPTALVSVALIVISLFSCAYMLERKVNL